MTSASHKLARFALNLSFENIPRDVIERAKACMIDTIGAAYYGSTLPWSRIIFGFSIISSRWKQCLTWLSWK